MISAILKRSLDLVASALLLLVFSPILLLTALGIIFQMGRPVLFRQQRPGRHRKPFLLFKFRTMNQKCDPTGQLLPDADRLTPLGRLLRRTSLDELPQLLNVLRGDMSLVGPRPLLTQYLRCYTARESLRFEVRPGITGWAQINGRNRSPWDERLERDAWYAMNQSFLLDVRILLITLLAVFRQQGAVENPRSVMPDLDQQRSGSREKDPHLLSGNLEQ